MSQAVFLKSTYKVKQNMAWVTRIVKVRFVGIAHFAIVKGTS